MKSLLFFCVVSLVPLLSYSSDVNVCNTLANVIAINQDRFDQADIALSDVTAICKDDVYPESCAEEIKTEYINAKTALETSQANYKKAGCEQ